MQLDPLGPTTKTSGDNSEAISQMEQDKRVEWFNEKIAARE
jgi:hypothetical protein